MLYTLSPIILIFILIIFRCNTKNPTKPHPSSKTSWKEFVNSGEEYSGGFPSQFVRSKLNCGGMKNYVIFNDSFNVKVRKLAIDM